MGLSAAFGLPGWTLILAVTAPSGSGSRIAVAPLALEGLHEPSAREQLTGGLLDGLARGPLEIVPPSALGPAAPENGCTDRSCLAGIASASEATYVVQTRVVVDERDYSIEISLADAKGNSVSTLVEQCDICGIDEVVALVADLAGGMQSKLDTLVRGAPVVNVTSTPSGARVFVDDQLVGMTPFTGNVPEGKHQLRVELAGYIVRKRTINSVEGAREDLDLELQPIPTDPRRRKGLIAGGAVAIGLGVAMVGGGIPLLLLDGKQNENDCSADNVDINGTCRWTYDTLAGGAGLVAGGGVLAAVGTGLLVRARIERKKLETQAFLGPAGLTVLGRF